MPILTDDQIIDFRQLVGDLCTPEDISGPQIQTLYDRAYAQSDCVDTVEAMTVVYILRRLWGLANRMVDQTGEFDKEKRSQYFDHIETMLKRWEPLAGIYGGALSVGVLDLDIDFTEDDLETGT